MSYTSSKTDWDENFLDSPEQNNRVEANIKAIQEEDNTFTGEKTFSENVNAPSLNTGHGENELYEMDQDVKTTDNVTFATVNTGQGANELYDMNQNVKTTDNVTFAVLDCDASSSTSSSTEHNINFSTSLSPGGGFGSVITADFITDIAGTFVLLFQFTTRTGTTNGYGVLHLRALSRLFEVDRTSTISSVTTTYKYIGPLNPGAYRLEVIAGAGASGGNVAGAIKLLRVGVYGTKTL